MLSQNRIKSVQIINNKFNPAEARDVVSSIIDEHVNFCKVQHLSSWERNHSIDGGLINNKIEELNDKKDALNRIINQAKESDCEIYISGTIEIKLVNKNGELNRVIDLLEVDQLCEN